MGKKANRLTRKLCVKLTAFAALSSKDSTIRNAVARCHLPVTTFYRHYRRQSAVAKPAPTRPRGHPTALSNSEEELIVCTLLRYAHRVYHLDRDDLLDCVEILVPNMPQSRRENTPFKNCRPTVKFARGFEKRHKNRLKFGKSSVQDAKRFAATNAETLTSYLVELQEVSRENNVDGKRIINLDETGVSPDKDGLGLSKRNHYGTRQLPSNKSLLNSPITIVVPSRQSFLLMGVLVDPPLCSRVNDSHIE